MIDEYNDVHAVCGSTSSLRRQSLASHHLLIFGFDSPACTALKDRSATRHTTEARRTVCFQLSAPCVPDQSCAACAKTHPTFQAVYR